MESIRITGVKSISTDKCTYKNCSGINIEDTKNFNEIKMSMQIYDKNIIDILELEDIISFTFEVDIRDINCNSRKDLITLTGYIHEPKDNFNFGIITFNFNFIPKNKEVSQEVKRVLK